MFKKLSIIVATAFLLTWNSRLEIQAAGFTIHRVHKNFKIVQSVIARFRTNSSQNCLHRCKIDAVCKLAAARQVSQQSAEVECIFGSLLCYEDVQEKIQQFLDWSVYELYERASRFYFAFYPARCLRYNYARQLLDFTQICSELFCSEEDGLYHIPTRMCVTTPNQGTKYLVLVQQCNQNSVFEQIPGPTVRQKNTGHCLHPKDTSTYPANGIEPVTWHSGCGFKFYFQKVYY